MPLHLSARLHAFWHRLFRPNEIFTVRSLHQDLEEKLARYGLGDKAGQEKLASQIGTVLAEEYAWPRYSAQTTHMEYFLQSWLEAEELFLLPEWREPETVAALYQLRAEIETQLGYIANIDAIKLALYHTTEGVFSTLYQACPQLLQVEEEGDLSFSIPLVYAIDTLPALVERFIQLFHTEDLDEAGIGHFMRDQLGRNLVTASGGDYHDPHSFNKSYKLPTESKLEKAELVTSYLAHTPLTSLFQQEAAITLPAKTRFSHHHIIGGTGHGKSQTLQYLIKHDLEAVAEGRRSVIVLDSQGDLINNIKRLKLFAPGEPLHEKLVLIDPTDVEYPVALNLFAVGQERLDSYAPLERERLLNSILELYDYILGSLLDAGLTQKQNVIFRYVTRLMLHIPGATIHTLRDVMEEDSHLVFAEHINKLSGSARHFFATEFASREFSATRKQVLRRLWGILENQNFERMFVHKESKFDLFQAMNKGQVILINTAKDLLKEQGSQLFGRFFIAMIAQAAQERAVLPEKKRLPTMVYIDEAQDYFDRNIGLILAQARKYQVGMVLAHQYLGQLSPSLQEAFAANTAIKMAGGVSIKDARALAPAFGADAETITAQPPGTFLTSIKGETKGALPLSFPFGYVEGLPQMTAGEERITLERIRRLYAKPVQAEENAPEAATPSEIDIEPGDKW